MSIQVVGVVGAGTMGIGIAQVFAQHGYEVAWFDVSPAGLERGKQAIARSLGRFVAKGVLTSEAHDAAIARIRFVGDLGALATADYVVEAIAEDIEAKARLFQDLDRIVRPDVVLASNTSSISITLLAAKTSRPGWVLGMHFMNPVPLMALVELVRGQQTLPATMALAEDLCVRIGKTPVHAADSPGFIANRILIPMINESVFALMEGVGTAEAIDTVMKLGANHPMGPLALADLIGLDVCLSILDVLYGGFGDPKYRACPLLRRMVAAGQLGRKTGQGFFHYDR